MCWGRAWVVGFVVVLASCGAGQRECAPSQLVACTCADGRVGVRCGGANTCFCPELDAGLPDLDGPVEADGGADAGADGPRADAGADGPRADAGADGPSCESGAACTLGACRMGRVACSSAGSSCVDVGAAPDGTSCEDGLRCTTGDQCVMGMCTGTSVVCPDRGSCRSNTCNPDSGQCEIISKADGTACDDGSACTTADRCVQGECLGASPVVCAPADGCHLAGTCDPGTGSCSSPNAPDGTVCTDGNACTSGDRCVGGACSPTATITCTASDACHVAGTCNPMMGTCSNPNAPDGTGCTDGDPCTAGDRCVAGACSPTGATTCPAPDACHAGVCSVAAGGCTSVAVANGTACTDTNACTVGDTCQSGTCTPGTAVTCTASDGCHFAGVCNPSTGVCSNPPRTDGTACNVSANLCAADGSTDGQCTGGVCVADQSEVSTLTGNGGTGYVDGTGGPNGTTQINAPSWVAVDPTGFLVVADGGFRLRKIAANGDTTTLAIGTYQAADVVAVDPEGRPVFENGAGLRRREADGTMTNLFDGQSTFPINSVRHGLAFRPDGTLYLLDANQGAILKIDPNRVITRYCGEGIIGYVDGPANSARFNFAHHAGLAVDPAGRLYVSDSVNQKVRIVDTDGSVRTLASVSWPRGLALDSAGNLYVAAGGSGDPAVSRGTDIIRIAPDGTQRTIVLHNQLLGAGYADGPLCSARFGSVVSVVVLGDSLYFGDVYNNRVRRITLR